LRYEKKGPALVAAAQEGADTILLVKPQTFMNRSGQAATWIKRHYGPQRTLVIYDEMDLPLGRFKFATTGSAGGHNGLKSLIGDLGTKDFDRLKVGIGHRGEAVGVDYVLEPFDYGDRAQVETLLDEAAKWVQLYIDRGIAVATQELQRSQRGRGQKPNQESPEEG
ncbi:MAG TPA: aminoacyl-tRNA hydrolase, partial [bacterium]|nr:aminoacyl-tRNA hydrolase [bacterium]